MDLTRAVILECNKIVYELKITSIIIARTNSRVGFIFVQRQNESKITGQADVARPRG